MQKAEENGVKIVGESFIYDGKEDDENDEFDDEENVELDDEISEIAMFLQLENEGDIDSDSVKKQGPNYLFKFAHEGQTYEAVARKHGDRLFAAPAESQLFKYNVDQILDKLVAAMKQELLENFDDYAEGEEGNELNIAAILFPYQKDEVGLHEEYSIVARFYECDSTGDCGLWAGIDPDTGKTGAGTFN
jgi:hypothetical protein